MTKVTQNESSTSFLNPKANFKTVQKAKNVLRDARGSRRKKIDTGELCENLLPGRGVCAWAGVVVVIVFKKGIWNHFEKHLGWGI
jgi:hypothetical protein